MSDVPRVSMCFSRRCKVGHLTENKTAGRAVKSIKSCPPSEACLQRMRGAVRPPRSSSLRVCAGCVHWKVGSLPQSVGSSVSEGLEPVRLDDAHGIYGRIAVLSNTSYPIRDASHSKTAKMAMMIPVKNMMAVTTTGNQDKPSRSSPASSNATAAAAITTIAKYCKLFLNPTSQTIQTTASRIAPALRPASRLDGLSPNSPAQSPLLPIPTRTAHQAGGSPLSFPRKRINPVRKVIASPLAITVWLAL